MGNLTSDGDLTVSTFECKKNARYPCNNTDSPTLVVVRVVGEVAKRRYLIGKLLLVVRNHD